jgi:hypothetical protein
VVVSPASGSPPEQVVIPRRPQSAEQGATILPQRVWEQPRVSQHPGGDVGLKATVGAAELFGDFEITVDGGDRLQDSLVENLLQR